MKSTKRSVPKGAVEIPVPFEVGLPEGTPKYMAHAYYGCLHWSLGRRDILENFKETTGKAIPATWTPLEAMIDDATGFDLHEDFLRAFVPWFNEWIWGAVDGLGEE